MTGSTQQSDAFPTSGHKARCRSMSRVRASPLHSTFSPYRVFHSQNVHPSQTVRLGLGLVSLRSNVDAACFVRNVWSRREMEHPTKPHCPRPPYAERSRSSSFEVVLVGFFPDALGYSSMGKKSGGSNGACVGGTWQAGRGRHKLDSTTSSGASGKLRDCRSHGQLFKPNCTYDDSADSLGREERCRTVISGMEPRRITLCYSRVKPVGLRTNGSDCNARSRPHGSFCSCALFVIRNELGIGNSLLSIRAILAHRKKSGFRMPYIVVVNHQTKGISLIPTEIKDAQKAIEQAKIENREPGYDWQHARVGYIPDGTS
jgi:hypothetical protein